MINSKRMTCLDDRDVCNGSVRCSSFNDGKLLWLLVCVAWTV